MWCFFHARKLHALKDRDLKHRARKLRVSCLPILVICTLLLSYVCVGCGRAPSSTDVSVDGQGVANDSNREPSDGSSSDKQKDDATGSDSDGSKAPLRDASPSVPEPAAPGAIVFGTDEIVLDASNTSDGYLAFRYNGTNEKVKIQLEMPDGVTCTYLVTEYGEVLIYPFSGGSGSYQVSVLESVDIEKNLYAIAFSQEIDVALSSEFAPFLTPNCYVNFQKESKCVEKGASLCTDCHSDLDAVSCIYNYVISHISYDNKKAQNVAYGYTPDPDETLRTGKGICFDYASLMTAMLRSQRIPTKLEVGYSGEVYHAWISCFVDEIGWVDGIIQFDGKNWSLMDPTLASNNKSSDVKKFIGDGSKYIVKYTY